MKHFFRTFILVMALMTSVTDNVWAAKEYTNTSNTLTVKVTRLPNDNAGSETVAFDGNNVTITISPTGNYKVANIVVEGTVDPSLAPPRRGGLLDNNIYQWRNTGTQQNIHVFTIPNDYNGANVTITFFKGEVIPITSLEEIDYPEDETKSYQLVADVDASGWTSIAEFKATLDGNFHKITNLSTPLFTKVNSGIVKNITFEGVTIDSGDGDGDAGAVCCKAEGSSRIYNCGILPSSTERDNDGNITGFYGSSVSGTGNVGGLVGTLSGNARVINCYSYANVSGGTNAAGIVGNNIVATTQSNLKTMVMNCMFYGNITGASTMKPVYGGTVISNAGASGVNNYNYYRNGEDVTFDDNYDNFAAYYCTLPADEEYLTRFEYYRSILNSNKRLCTWWINGTSETAPTDANVEAVGIAKWVLDPEIAPYPILKKWGKYPSVINQDPEYVWNPKTQQKVSRTSAEPYQGKRLGTISVTVNAGAKHAGTGNTSVTLPSVIVMDMDTLNHDYGYAKIQLPYYNEVFGDPTANADTQWDKRYAGNYKDYVVTGWKITNVSGGTPGSFKGYAVTSVPTATSNVSAGTVTPDEISTTAWEDGFNFADRNCTNKDLYSKSGRVFAQGGYYYVPEGVNAITIEAYWGKAVYLHNSEHSLDRVNVAAKESKDGSGGADNTGPDFGSPFTPAGTLATTFQTYEVKTNLQDAIAALTNNASYTVYDQAIVLVGNVQVKNRGGSLSNGSRAFTIMSCDLDMDNEPDYCLQFQQRNKVDRPPINPVRFDFLPVPELGLAIRTNTFAYAIGLMVPKGHFEITETSFMHTTQFEYDYDSKDRSEAPLILNGGHFEQIVVRKGPKNRTSYILMGGHFRMKRFTPGWHATPQDNNPIRHCAVNAIGGEYPEFYLSGIYAPDKATSEDNPHCYTNGGYFGLMAGAGYEQVRGDVTFKIDHSIIREFYGGGINAAKPVTGKIDVTINNSLVGKYCGGPKVGSMEYDDNGVKKYKTVTTNATGTTFGVFYGGGNGGTSYYRDKQYDNTREFPTNDNVWMTNSGAYTPNFSAFTPLNQENVDAAYKNSETENWGYHAEYEFEVFNSSNGLQTSDDVIRLYYHWAQFGTTTTGDVTSTLTNCTVTGDFFGGGNLATVTGDVTSTLKGNTHIYGSAFAAGYSASIPSFPVHNKSTVRFPKKDKAGNVAEQGSLDYYQDGGKDRMYTWCYKNASGKTFPEGVVIPEDASTNTKLKSVFKYPNTDAGKWYVLTNVSLEGLGAVSGNAKITLDEGCVIDGSVYGGGEESSVDGNTEVNVSGGTIGVANAAAYGALVGNVYGGGKGKDNDKLAGLVKGNTNITISGSPMIYHNIYGGGAYGSVGEFIYDTTTGIPTARKENTTGGACTVTIKGGTIGWNGKENGMVFGSSRGDVATPGGDGVDPNDRLAWVYSTHVIIGDANVQTSPTINGSVYGSGENGHTFQNTIVDIKKGTVGITDTSIDGGAAYPYRGNVYGGGCGTDTYWIDANNNKVVDDGEEHYNLLAGIVKGNATVNISGGHVVHNVYGAGAMGSVGTANDENSGETTINITGGRIGYDGGSDGKENGNVFGAARGEYGISTAASGLANVRKSVVNISYTTTPASDNTEKTAQLIAGSVFGGGEAGVVRESVSVNMTGGLILKDVYGGGALADTQTSNWDASANSGAGGWATGKSSSSSTTTVRLTGGTILGEAYGGGLGEAASTGYPNGKPAYVWGDVLVDLNGTTTMDNTTHKPTVNGTATVTGEALTSTKGCAVGQVFGANNINGTPKGDVMVHVYATQNQNTSAIAAKVPLTFTEPATDKVTYWSTQATNVGLTPATVIGTATADADKINLLKAAIEAIRYDVSAVYGGGNKAAYIPVSPYTTSNTSGAKTQVIIEGCGETSIETVYGGGNAAAVPETNVEVRSAYEIGYVFGGGNGYSATNNHTDPTAANYNPGADIGVYKEGTTETTYGTGDANAILKGGFIHEAYGGSNQKGNIKGKININTNPQGTTCDLCVDKLVGAGKNADVDGDLIMILGCKPTTKTPLVFAGADNADVNGNVELTITSGTFGQVFGGNNEGGAIKGHILLNIEETGCNPIVIDELYLGGNQAAYSRYGYYNAGTTENPNIQPRTAAMHAITNTSDPNYKAPITNPSNDDNKHPFPYAEPVLNVISCTSIGKVFGGGWGAGAIMHADPTVNINMIPGAFASQLGAAHALGAIGDVFGGGNAADVYGDATVNIGTATTVTLTSVADDQSTAEVNESLKTVEGANITGDVFGGGYSADVKGNTQVNICAVKSGDTYTGVTIAGTDYHGVKILGSIYGGGDLGSVGTFKYATSTYDGINPGSDLAAGKPTGFTANTGKSVVAIMGNAEIGLDNMKMYHSEITDGTDKPDDKGHVFGAGKGKLEAPSATSNVELTSYVDNTVVTIGGNAFVKGSVYGGSENGHVLHDTYVNIQGGQIGCGKNTTARHPDDVWADTYTANETTELWSPSWEYKSPFAPFDPNANASGELGQYSNGHSTEGGRKIASDGHTYYGNVFGGGSGSVPYFDETAGISKYLSTAGSVEGDTHVTISGGHILTSVYGGCETTNVKGTANVTMTGGTIGVPRTDAQIIAHPVTGYLFGAGKGDQRVYFNKETNVNDAVVKVEGGRIYGSVYGGGEDGHVLRNVELTIGKADHTGPTIGTKGTSYYDGHVFGGGRGFGGEALTAGNVGGAVTLNIESGSVLGSVYGGGRLASVGYGLYLTTEDGYGEMRADDEYDGSYTNPSTEAAGTFFNKGRGHITVDIKGGTVGNENASGDGAKYSGNVFGGSMGRLNLLDGTTRSDIWPLMAQVKSTAVNIYGDAVIRRNVFGGGELGVVRDDAYVTIGGYKTANADADGNVAVTASGSPTVRRDVFGGGYGSEDKQHTIISVKESGTNNTYAYTPMQFAGCVGKNTYVNVVGGYIRKSVYGGGEMASVGVIDYKVTETTSDPAADKVKIGPINNKTYYYNNVVKHGDPNTQFALSWPYKFNYVDGYPGATHIKVTGGRLGLKDGDTDTGFEDNGDVYGAGKGMAGDYKDYLFCANVGSTNVEIDHSGSNSLTEYSGTADLIAGAVYGGGEDGHVIGNAKVTMKKGFVYHSLYGAGSGKGKYNGRLLKIGAIEGSTTESDYYNRSVYSITAGKVFGNTEVEISGGMVVRNVYGGGNMGSVGKGNYAGGSDDYSTDGYGEKVSSLWSNTDFTGSGKCTVKITGGTIGYIDTPTPSNSMYPYNSPAGLPYGNVFGGCRGEAAPDLDVTPSYLYSPEFFMGYVNETEVTIEGANTKILGSVYGGGMDGHVRRDATVTIKGGEIGIPFTDDNKNNVVKTSAPENIQWLARGNVYGSGSGIGTYNADNIQYSSSYTGTQVTGTGNSTSAGSVTRFTKVDIQGGTIYRNVYGGGSLSSIGAPKINQTYDEYRKGDTNHTEVGKQTLNEVVISGGQIGDENSYDANGNYVYGGRVFGGSRGDASLDATKFSTSMFTSVSINANATPANSPVIYGSVFGGGEVGIVKGSVDVTMNGGTVNHDVYGGGALANTNTETSSSVPYTTTVNLFGGLINGDAYGGGLGQLEEKTGETITKPAIEAVVHGNVHVTLGNETEVETEASATKFTIDYLTDNSDPSKPVQVVKSGRVFGCNNLNGSPKGNVTVTVNRTARVKDNNGDIVSRTAITRDATTSEITSIATPHIYEVAAVYGGGNLADYTASGKKTRVEIMTCDVSIEEVYGGGNAAKVSETDVEVKGAHQIERVFGGGNGKDKYTLDGGTNWIDNPGADIVSNAKTIIKGGLIHEAYGGSNEKGTITGNITINTETGGCAGCPTQIDKLVGAGKNADVNGDLVMILGCYPTTKTPLIFAGADNANVNGNVELTITSGTFVKVFGGNNQGGAIKGHIKLNIEETGCNPIKIEELYLGGNEAAYSVYGYNADGSCITSGAKAYDADPVLNVVSCTSIGKVFGGGYGVGGKMYADPTVNINMIPGEFASSIDKTADNPDQLGAIGDVYGGGNAADVIGNPTVNIGTASKVRKHLSYTPPTDDSTDGYTYSDYEDVKGAYITGNVFGAGMGKDDTFTCEKAMVGIDGDGVANPDGGTTVNIYNGVVLGSVYGGGEVGRVEKNTAVTIGTGDGVATGTPTSAPVIKGSVFGGGKGLETHGYSALVRGNPTVTVQGNAKVRGNVYGGGQIASVARYNVAQTDDEGAPYGVKKDEPYALKTNNSGFCTVTIKGYAEIGPETVASDAKTTSVGHVFGAGKGILPGGDYAFVQGTTKRMVSVKNEQGQITGSDWEKFATEADYITFVKTLALSSQTNVTIDGNAKVKGSVFGGSESGFVQFDANVNVLGGTIGTQGKGGADFGNVYGGGKGDVEYTGANHDYITAGIVKGNTKVVISQAEGKTTKILHNVYGGGAYGTVGEFEYDATGMPTARKTYTVGTEVHNTTGGKAEIYITGGTIGTNGNENGMVFGSSRGDVGAPGSIHDKAAWVYDTHVAIGDTVATTTTTVTPLIKGSVYGGGENGHNLHNAYVRINGGTIGIPEGEPIGSYTSGGASYPYRGNVYGGGCGTDKYDNDTKYNPLAGIVRGDVTINMTAGHVVHNMYGAGAMGSVGKKVVTAGVTTITGGTTTININGGTLGVNDDSDEDGNVFGAARGATDATGSDLAMVFANANVSVSGGTVYGSVFGGGQRGVTLGSVAVNMTGGSVSKDIYGGGALADTNTGALSNTTTTYKTIVNLLGGTIGGDAYGGGLGQLGAEPVEAKVYGDTKVNLNGLEAGDYAEGIHKPLTEGTTARLVSIVDDNNQVKEYQINDAVQGAVVGRIFGCNNLNGSPQGTVKVHVFKTQRAGQTRITNTSEVTTAKVKVEPTDGEYNLKSFDVEAVYGGGNMAAYVPDDLTTGTTQVIIDGCDRTSIGQVYGGGNAASCPATDVTVNGSFEIAEVFGGGNGKDKITINSVEKDNPGANVGFYDYSAVEDTYNTKEERQQQAFVDQYVYGTGKAAVNIYGGTIHRVFGGSNTKGNVRQSAITMLEDAEACTFCVDEAYGGGKSAPMDAEAKLLMACIPGLNEVYGGAQAADVFDDVTVNITNGTFDRVFGGNNLSGTIRGKITVNIEETGCRPVIIGELYGGGNQAGYSVYGYDVDTYGNVKLKESGDSRWDDPQVNVKSFTSIGTIYGGGFGEGATMVGNPTVNINETVGSPKAYPTTGDDFDENGFKGKTITVAGHEVTLPSHKRGQIGAINNVFGGGNAAKVIGNTNVNIGTEATQTFVSVDDDQTTDVNEKVKTVVGVDIRGNVYGGGNNAEVTGNTNVTIGKENTTTSTTTTP